MEREIKFRAWDRRLKRFSLDFLISPNGRICLNFSGDYVNTGDIDDDIELMQYTGLKDKNGKEIYEGDIVRGFEKEAGFPPYDSTLPRAIEFRDGCWCFNANRYDEGDWIRFGFWTHSNKGKTTLKQLEVIGNIYENPELVSPTPNGEGE